MEDKDSVALAVDIGHKVVTSLRAILAITVLGAFGAGAFFARIDSRLEVLENYVVYMTDKTIPKIERIERNQIRMESKMDLDLKEDNGK